MRLATERKCIDAAEAGMRRIPGLRNFGVRRQDIPCASEHGDARQATLDSPNQAGACSGGGSGRENCESCPPAFAGQYQQGTNFEIEEKRMDSGSMDAMKPMEAKIGEIVDDRETVYLWSGVALVICGAGLILANAGVRRYLSRLGSSEFAQKLVPELERLLRRPPRA